ncbi:histone-lysine N-methyltransferase SMYD3 isoform X3 [Gasterosteus aculeatus]
MPPKLKRFVSPGKGNGLRATVRIRRGELVYSAEPLACCVSNKLSRDVCHHCFSRRENLLRCSQCKMARYCNTTCQKQAWCGHKTECKCLKSLRPRVPTDSVRLAARLIFALLSPSKSSSEELYTLEEHESHLSSMSENKKQGLSQLASMLELYVQQEVPDLAQEGASALPPSCRDPLSLIAKLTISYIETLSSTEERRRQLEDQYHFTCRCQHCDSQDKDGLMLSGHKSTWDPLKEALPRLEGLKAESDWQALLEGCSHLLSTVGCDVSDENVYKLRMTDMAADACIHLGHWEEAVGYGEKTLPVYSQYYPDPHPVHGVQLVRVAKLQHYLERIEDALDTFKQAYRIIKLTHGDDHPMTARLLMKMEECRAEMVQFNSR